MNAIMLSTAIPDGMFKTSIMSGIGDSKESTTYTWQNPSLCLLDVYKEGQSVLLIEKDGQTNVIELLEKNIYMEHVKELLERIEQLEKELDEKS